MAIKRKQHTGYDDLCCALSGLLCCKASKTIGTLTRVAQRSFIQQFPSLLQPASTLGLLLAAAVEKLAPGKRNTNFFL